MPAWFRPAVAFQSRAAINSIFVAVTKSAAVIAFSAAAFRAAINVVDSGGGGCGGASILPVPVKLCVKL